MAMRRVDTSPLMGLREQMISHIEDLRAGRPHADRMYGRDLEQLRGGGPVVVPGWKLWRYRIPGVSQRLHAYYRLEPDGSVVEVVPRRDPSNPASILGWEEVR